MLVSICTFTYPLPYYIYTGGGLIDVNSKISFSTKTLSTGSYNMCYVSELRATIPSYLLSFFKSDWEVEKITDVAISDNETDEDIYIRDKIYLDTGNISAVLNAFKYANLDVEIIDSNPIVIYVLEEAKNNLKIGDEILSINGIDINDVTDISNVLEDINVGDKVSVKVLNNDIEYERYAYIIEEDNRKLLGVSLENKTIIKTNPEINFKFSSSESGPSGGLILTLALYDYLIDEDMTKGLKISGTGTIDNDGNVGSIGGVKYKLAGAVSEGADIFFVPNGENYDEAISLKKEKNYDIEIIGVSTFEEALNYLKNN